MTLLHSMSLMRTYCGSLYAHFRNKDQSAQGLCDSGNVTSRAVTLIKVFFFYPKHTLHQSYSADILKVKKLRRKKFRSLS